MIANIPRRKERTMGRTREINRKKRRRADD